MSTAPQRQSMAQGETRNIAVDFRGKLDSGELLTGTPTVEEVATASLTLTSKAVNTVALTILGETVAIGQAAQFKVVAAAAGLYTVRLTCATNAVPAQTLVENIKLKVISN